MNYRDTIAETEDFLDRSTYHNSGWKYDSYQNHYADQSAVDNTGIRQIVNLTELNKSQRAINWILRSIILVLGIGLVYIAFVCM